MRPTAQDSKKSRHRSGIDIKLRDENRRTRSGAAMNDNSVDERIIKSRPDNDPNRDSERGVAASHQKDNSTNSRILASRNDNSSGFNSERAVDFTHQKDNSTNSRILSSGPNEADRAVDSEHQKTNSTVKRVLATFPHEVQADGSTAKDPEGSTNLSQNSLRAIDAEAIRARSLKSYLFPDNEIGGAKLAAVPAAKVTGTLNKARIPELSELRGKIGRANINYPSHNNEGASRPFVSEMIADNQVGPRIIDLAWLQDYIDSKWARK